MTDSSRRSFVVGASCAAAASICSLSHDERLIQRFIEGNTDAWLEEGCPFHFWLTSPACEVVDVTFAMNLGWASNRCGNCCSKAIAYEGAGMLSNTFAFDIRDVSVA